MNIFWLSADSFLLHISFQPFSLYNFAGNNECLKIIRTWASTRHNSICICIYPCSCSYSIQPQKLHVLMILKYCNWWQRQVPTVVISVQKFHAAKAADINGPSVATPWMNNSAVRAEKLRFWLKIHTKSKVPSSVPLRKKPKK